MGCTVCSNCQVPTGNPDEDLVIGTTTNHEAGLLAEGEPMSDSEVARFKTDRTDRSDDAVGMRQSSGSFSLPVTVSASEVFPADQLEMRSQAMDAHRSSKNSMDSTHTTMTTGSRLRAAISSVQWAGIKKPTDPIASMSNLILAKPSGNTNTPQDYIWLRESLERLAANEAPMLGAVDHDTAKSFTPLFFVIGACPNALCGMQAVMYCVSADSSVDFWWVKPSKSDPSRLEPETLSRHSKGVHKNDPGRSRQFYKPLADIFEQGEIREGWRFGIVNAKPIQKGAEAKRAYLEREVQGHRKGYRLYVHLMWQEDWTSNPLARSKYIKGRIVYQRNVGARQFFSRQYEIHDGVVFISEYEESPFSAALPTEEVKRLWELGLGGTPSNNNHVANASKRFVAQVNSLF
mmetsp:Transcript_63073/g.137039  ORF Transcript_63073/g.137039 Transcript_63073/m.137039 type:complete len:404 (+) Transcript_63073:95-1306(+)